MSDSEAASVLKRSTDMGAEDDSLVSTRPKLVDVRRRGIANVLRQQRTTTAESTKSVTSSSSSSSESDSEDESLPDDERESDGEVSSAGDDDEESWTVRVSLISAVDLPLHIVPNMPLCPVVKFGLITLPGEENGAEKSGDGEVTEAQSSSAQKSSIVSRIESSGLSSIPRARVRCTSNKILSKRDNGSVEFHEEMRWDKVKRPMQAALVVELSAKASLPPSNLKESPLIMQSKASETSPQPVPSPWPSLQSEVATGTQRSSDIGGGVGSETDQRPYIERSQSGDSTSENETPAVPASNPSISRSGSTDGEDAAPSVHGAGLTGMRALWKEGASSLSSVRLRG